MTSVTGSNGDVNCVLKKMEIFNDIEKYDSYAGQQLLFLLYLYSKKLWPFRQLKIKSLKHHIQENNTTDSGIVSSNRIQNS